VLADGEHVVADAQLVGVAELHGGQVVRVDLQHGDVGAAIRAQHLGLEFPVIR
jgi:hypothetical protein